MIFFIIILIILFLIFNVVNRKKNLPPGPFGLPYFGYYFFLNHPIFKSIHDLSKSWGNLFSFTAFGKTVVVITDYSMIKNCLMYRKEFSGRTTLFVNGLLAQNHGISNYDGKSVTNKIRVCKQFLRMSDNIESIIDIESLHLINHIKTLSGKSIYSRILFNKAVSNIIWKFVFGRRFNYSDSVALANVEKVAINNSQNDIISFRQFLPLILIPVVKRLNFVRRFLKLNEILYRYKNILGFLQKEICKCNVNVKMTSNCFPFEMEKGLEKIKFTDNESLRLTFELFAAGTDTIILTIQWGMLLLALHPEEQEKMRTEILQNITENKDGKIVVSWNDVKKLRYCQQVTTEIHRYASVVPLALPHRVLKSCKLEGYDIPKDSVLLIGIYSVHHDSNLWDEPSKFKPERFNGRSLTDKIIQFSLGLRSCPGFEIAQVEIFTIITNIVNNFQICPAKENLSLDDLGVGTSGMTRAPNYHEVIFKSL